MKKQVMDGNTACAEIAYNFIEVAGIYPITPASTMAELIDKYASEGRKNLLNSEVKVVQMQSEAGAIGMVHGSLQMGVLTSTFTASQGLLLMLPNMYKIAGECLPCVINVAARTIATHALSIMGDHSDIYAARPTGFAILASSSVQDVMNLTAVSYLSTLEGKVPFINFFDGFRTSHELQKINILEQDDIKDLINKDSLNDFRMKALDIHNPVTRGTNQSDMIFFENSEVRNNLYNKLPDVVNNYMIKINEKMHTDYRPFNYYGAPDATKIIIAMGSVTETIKETIDKLEDKIGLIEVHLYRPFSVKYLMDVLPSTVSKIAVLDRTKEPGSIGEPLYLDVVAALKDKNIKIIGGRYGLSSKDTTPNDIEAIYNFLDQEDCFNGFTVGINDDVTNLSLDKTSTAFTSDNEEFLIYGYGSDGMVTASKDILKIIGEETDNYVQGYFEYDSKKSGGVTISHLRFGKEPIRSSYYIQNPSLVVCSKASYLKKYDILKNIKKNGIFILNTSETLDEVLTVEDIKIIKERNISVYTIDANKISQENNIPNKISSIIETIIFKVTNIIPSDEAIEKIKEKISKNFAKKGEEIVVNNIKALENAINSYQQQNVDNINSKHEKEKVQDTVFSKLEHLKKEDIKVSDFIKHYDGTYEPGLSKLEKRNISKVAPCYDKEKCIMCNLCSFVCPHAVIRPFLLDEEEINNAPNEVKEDLKDSKINNLAYTIGISTMDCTGCTLCTKVCPTKAVTMQEIKEKETLKSKYLFEQVKEKPPLPVNTIKGSQFVNPSFEFHGACAGCGETPYLKLLTQLFKDNMIIANATGCSSIYGASLPNTPYSIPWANSLFEDNAEFGLGMKVSDEVMKQQIKNIMLNNLDKVNEKNKILFEEYLNNYSIETSKKVNKELDYENIPELNSYKNYIVEKSIWIVGGDGWAYDIGFSGIDHVLASNENVNILVLDTEVYSNTGGQASKSTRIGATAKFAESGKQTPKKDLARIAMTYDNVYVGTVSLGYNYQHTINTLKEAEQHKGPSIIIAYAPCIAHGIKSGMKDSLEEEKLATKSGYFPLFRYNPKTKQFKLDSQADFSLYDELLNKEARYNKKDLHDKNQKESIKRYDYYKKLESENII